MSTEAPTQDVELLCPLCEYNLRGLPEPRCPECGHQSSWEELRLAQPNHPYLFERHLERNVSSFFQTLFRSFLPRRFWGGLSATLRPVPKRLYAFGFLIVVFTFGGSFVSAAYDIYATAQWNQQARQREATDAFEKHTRPHL